MNESLMVHFQEFLVLTSFSMCAYKYLPGFIWLLEPCVSMTKKHWKSSSWTWLYAVADLDSVQCSAFFHPYLIIVCTSSIVFPLCIHYNYNMGGALSFTSMIEKILFQEYSKEILSEYAYVGQVRSFLQGQLSTSFTRSVSWCSSWESPGYKIICTMVFWSCREFTVSQNMCDSVFFSVCFTREWESMQ